MVPEFVGSPGSLNLPQSTPHTRQDLRNELGGNGNQSTRASWANHVRQPVRTGEPSLSHCITPSSSLFCSCITSVSSLFILLMMSQHCHFFRLLCLFPLVALVETLTFRSQTHTQVYTHTHTHHRNLCFSHSLVVNLSCLHWGVLRPNAHNEKYLLAKWKTGYGRSLSLNVCVCGEFPHQWPEVLLT